MKYFVNRKFVLDGATTMGEYKTSMSYSDKFDIPDPPEDWNMTQVTFVEYYLYKNIEWLWRLAYGN